MLGSETGECTTLAVEGYIKEMRVGYYGGSIQRIIFVTDSRIYITGIENNAK